MKASEQECRRLEGERNSGSGGGVTHPRESQALKLLLAVINGALLRLYSPLLAQDWSAYSRSHEKGFGKGSLMMMRKDSRTVALGVGQEAWS